MIGEKVSDTPGGEVRVLQVGSIGRHGGFNGDRAAMLAVNTNTGRVSPSAVAQVKALEKAGWPVIVIDTSDQAFEWPSWATVVQRRNIAQDWGSWATALNLFPGLYEARTLLQMNDSMIGPFYPMGGVLKWFESQDAHYVGVTDNTEIEWHLSAMLVAYCNGAISHPAYRSFWEDVRVLAHKGEHIYAHELELSRIAARNNLRARAMFTTQETGETWAPLTFGWRALLEMGLPLVKRRTIHLYPHEVREAAVAYGHNAVAMVDHALREAITL